MKHIKEMKKFFESITIDDTRLNKTTFEYNGNQYRLTSYLYVYRFKDGGDSIRCAVHKKDANCVGGAGIAGVIAPISDVKFLDRQTTWDEETIKELEQTFENRVKKDEYLYLKTCNLKPNMTRSEYDDMVIDDMFDKNESYNGKETKEIEYYDRENRNHGIGTFYQLDWKIDEEPQIKKGDKFVVPQTKDYIGCLEGREKHDAYMKPLLLTCKGVNGYHVSSEKYGAFAKDLCWKEVE